MNSDFDFEKFKKEMESGLNNIDKKYENYIKKSKDFGDGCMDIHLTEDRRISELKKSKKDLKAILDPKSIDQIDSEIIKSRSKKMIALRDEINSSIDENSFKIVCNFEKMSYLTKAEENLILNRSIENGKDELLENINKEIKNLEKESCHFYTNLAHLNKAFFNQVDDLLEEKDPNAINYNPEFKFGVGNFCENNLEKAFKEIDPDLLERARHRLIDPNASLSTPLVQSHKAKDQIDKNYMKIFDSIIKKPLDSYDVLNTFNKVLVEYKTANANSKITDPHNQIFYNNKIDPQKVFYASNHNPNWIANEELFKEFKDDIKSLSKGISTKFKKLFRIPYEDQYEINAKKTHINTFEHIAKKVTNDIHDHNVYQDFEYLTQLKNVKKQLSRSPLANATDSDIQKRFNGLNNALDKGISSIDTPEFRKALYKLKGHFREKAFNLEGGLFLDMTSLMENPYLYEQRKPTSIKDKLKDFASNLFSKESTTNNSNDLKNTFANMAITSCTYPTPPYGYESFERDEAQRQNKTYEEYKKGLDPKKFVLFDTAQEAKTQKIDPPKRKGLSH